MRVSHLKHIDEPQITMLLVYSPQNKICYYIEPLSIPKGSETEAPSPIWGRVAYHKATTLPPIRLT